MKDIRDRARKLAAHAKYDTNEGRVALGLLREMVEAHPELAQYLPEEHRARKKRSRSREEAPPPHRRPRREYLQMTHHLRGLAATLAASMGLSWEYVRGIEEEDFHRMEVLGDRETCSRYLEEWQRHADAVEVLLEVVAEAYLRQHFDEEAIVALHCDQARGYTFEAISRSPGQWLRRERKREQRMAAARERVNVERLLAGARQYVKWTEG